MKDGNIEKSIELSMPNHCHMCPSYEKKVITQKSLSLENGTTLYLSTTFCTF